MQQESKANKYSFRNWLKTHNRGRIIGIILLVILANYLIILLIIPGIQVRRLDRSYAALQENESSPLKFSEHSELFTLQKKKTFLEARLKMARTDSIGLAVDLPDSVLTLDINGIILHRAKINRYKASKTFRAINPETCLGLCSEPLRIISHRATVERIPVIYRKAPKDSIEAAEYLSEVPDTIITKPPMVIFSADHYIQLHLYPSEDIPFSGKFIKLMFNTVQELKLHRYYLSCIIRLKLPAYHPRIKIYLADREIISIYRALPEDARLTIMF
jgi:hypothetical protein